MCDLQDNVRPTDTDQSTNSNTVAQKQCRLVIIQTIVNLPNHHRYTVRLGYFPIATI